MGKMLTCLPRLTLAQLRTLRSTTVGTCHRDLENLPTPQWETHVCSARCLQGGGVFVQGGSVTISSCTISGNSAIWVCASHACKSPSPDGKVADVLAPTHACTTANASVNYRIMHVPQRRCKVPVAPMGKCLADMPNSTLAVRLGSNLVLPGICMCHACKMPIAPMGNSCFARCLQGGGISAYGGTVAISSCTISGNTAAYVRAHVQKFPWPRWENALLT